METDPQAVNPSELASPRKHPDGQERREAPRRPVVWQAGLIYKTQSGMQPIFGTVLDISRNGVTFESTVHVMEKNTVVLAMRMPPERPGSPPTEVQAEATVISSIVTSSGFRSGLRLQKFLMAESDFLHHCL